MNYCMYKLKFSTPLHVGQSESARSVQTSSASFCADTLFSALCHAALDCEGETGLKRLFADADKGSLRFSDAMPFKGEVLYIPKPYTAPKVRRETDPKNRKAMKKLSFIPVALLPLFSDSINGKCTFEAGDVDGDFGVSDVSEKVAITGNDKTEPYSVGLFSFHKDCGLYITVGYESEQELEFAGKLIRILGAGGIGGKVSSGYGKFEVIDKIYLDSPFDKHTEMLSKALSADSAGSYMTLSASLPRDDELDNAMDGSSYSLIRRGGYVFSESFMSPVKKQTQYFFCAGSVFKNRFCGDIYNVSPGWGHPVYRYGKPVFLGVDI